MECFNQCLPMLLYFLGAILLVTMIILSIYAIKTVKNLNNLVDDANRKVESLNVFFDILDKSADKIALLNDKLVEKFFSKIFGKKKEEEKDGKKK